MFSWICPKCGREVPPSYTECPDCAPSKADEPAPVTTAAPAPPPVSAPARPANERAAPYEPAVARSTSPWMVMLFAAIGIVALLTILYLYVLPAKKTVSATTPAAGEQAAQNGQAPAAAQAKTPHPYAKFLEVTGVRVNEDAKQRAQVQFIVVNHSAADLPEMKMQITVRSGGKSLFDFPYTVPSLGPFETKEASTALKTELKPYELPDWQFIKADFDITSTPE